MTSEIVLFFRYFVLLEVYPELLQEAISFFSVLEKLVLLETVWS